jgi:hypothetical protein
MFQSYTFIFPTFQCLKVERKSLKKGKDEKYFSQPHANKKKIDLGINMLVLEMRV